MSEALQSAVSLLSGMPSPERVSALESVLLEQPQVDLGTEHLVHGGVYARTIFIPKDTILTGAVTAKANICTIYGDITVTTDAGPVRLTGYHVIPALPGFKRVGVAHEDTWWTTVMATELTDVEAIEEEMTPEADRLQTRNNLIGHDQVQTLEA